MAIDMSNVIGQVRRLVFDRDSSNYTRTDAEMALYISDAVADIQLDYFEFDDYVVSGTYGLTPVPDNIDARLMAIRAGLNITHEDIREAGGDAILIQTGDIKLDTSKSPPQLKTNLEFLEKEYNNMIISLNKDGKSNSSAGTGIRVDNYIESTKSRKSSDSYI
jgi:hypothetical protein